VDRKRRRKASRDKKPVPPPTKMTPPPVPPKHPPVAADDGPDPLTARERMFVDEYIADPNATQAYRRAFKCKSYATAQREGSRLRSNPHISSEIEAARKAQAARTRITADRTLREIARIAFADTRDLFGEDERLLPITKVPIETRRAIQSVKVKRSKIYGAPGEGAIGEEDVIEVKMASKDASLGRLMKHLGLAKEMMPLDAFLSILPEGLRRQLVEAMAKPHAGDDASADGGDGDGAAGGADS